MDLSTPALARAGSWSSETPTEHGVLPDNRLVQLKTYTYTFSVYDAVGAFVQDVNLPLMGFPDSGLVAIGKDGRIVTVYSNNLMAIFNADFTPDSSVCPNGVCYTNGGIPRIANDGKIILAAFSNVSRYLPNGSVDTGFGISGVIQFNATGAIKGVAVDDAGRVLVGRSAVYGQVWVIEADGSSAELIIQFGHPPPADIHL